MADRIFEVLFLCTGDSARSILAEDILQKDGASRFRAFSARNQPKDAVNPLALQTLREWDYQAEGFHSKTPAAVEGTDIAIVKALNVALLCLKTRISLFTGLPITKLDTLALGAKLRGIGQAERASAKWGDAA